jgi:hypothetical protein
MRRTKLILGVLGLMMAMMVAFAAPAMAQDRDFDGFDDNDGFFFIVDDFDNNDDDFCDFFDCDNNNNDDDFCDFFDCNNDDDFFDNDGFFGGDGFQSFDQEADSGDVDQSFDVSGGGGDNSNQTVNVSGNANTGNLQDQFGFTQIGSEIDEFEIDGGGSSIEVGGDSDVSSNQDVNQAASSG